MGFFSRKKAGRTDSDDQYQNTVGRSSRKPSLSMASSSNSRSTEQGNGPNALLMKPPDPTVDPAAYLKSIYAVRDRCSIVHERAKQNRLLHFDVDMSKFKDTAQFVVSIIKRDFAPDYASIPPHGRWQHFEVGGIPRIDQLMSTWPNSVDALERTRRLMDLFLVSVLLDAGAGTKWQYKSRTNGKYYRRSEGLAVASLEMFSSGLFSSDPNQPCQVDGAALQKLRPEQMAEGLQATPQNPIEGLEGRTQLLIRLGSALQNKAIFGQTARPGNMLDCLLSNSSTQSSASPVIPLPTFWDTLMAGLAPIWPDTRTQINGTSLGDAWPCNSMPIDQAQPWEKIVPFHKLTQWLTYSLMVPMQRFASIQFAGVELMTGLPEYRNGGLLVDTGLLTLKPHELKRGLDRYNDNASLIGQPSMEVVPLFAADDDVIVEWRAVTVGFLDMLLEEVNSLLGLNGGNKLNLAQMLEAGTWKGGRELAELSRPNTREPPIMIISDGSVF